MNRERKLSTHEAIILDGPKLEKLIAIFEKINTTNSQNADQKVDKSVRNLNNKFNDIISSAENKNCAFSNNQITLLKSVIIDQPANYAERRQEESVGKYKITVKTSRSGIINCDNFDDLKKLENSDNDYIYGLSITLRTLNSNDIDAEFSMPANYSRAQCDVLLSGDHEKITFFEREFEDFLSNLVAPYSKKLDAFNRDAISLIYIVGMISFSLFVILQIISIERFKEFMQDAGFAVFMLTGIGSFIFCMFAITYIGEKITDAVRVYFPSSVFALNQGLDRYNSIVGQRGAFYTAVLIPIIIAILSVYVTLVLTPPPPPQ